MFFHIFNLTFNQTLNLFDIIYFDTQNNMFKKIICKFFFYNFEIFLFFFPKNIQIKNNIKLVFALRLYSLYFNFNTSLKFKFILFLIFLNFVSILFFFKPFKNITILEKKKLIKKLMSLKINNLSRGIFALRSQSIIIFYSIFKDQLNEF